MRLLINGIYAFASLVSGSARSIDSYITSETPIAKAGVLANIGSAGSKSSGAFPGVVIASPSTVNPDYLYSWTRDSALVFKVLIDQYTQGRDTSLAPLIDEYIVASQHIQQISNPSGTVSTGGLGEPKFNINETAFTGPWGRPQRDGPALRATAMITYANWLIAHGNASHVKSFWPVIKRDLDYTMNNWNRTTFDLWEEVESSSFFTTAVQHRALREGAALVKTLKLSQNVSDGYTTQAANALCFLQSYWNAHDGYMIANTALNGRSGKDSNTVLASIHTFDSKAGCDAATFQPCSDRALSNLKVYVDSFRGVYKLNNGIVSNAAVNVGRYSEDVYQGGNPWYLSTFAVAEQIYYAIYVWKSQGSLAVTTTSLPFFQQFQANITIGKYAATCSTYKTLVADIAAFADGFVALNAKYTPSDGSLAEQYDRNNGSPLSAVDLTWSYASALTAFAARARQVPASWGAAGVVVPKICLRGQQDPVLSATFKVKATTVPGGEFSVMWQTWSVGADLQHLENIYLVGSVPQLQSWNPDKALMMSPVAYPIWSLTVDIPASSHIEYKYIRKLNGGVTWSSDPNFSTETPGSGNVTISDVWR